jgi:hypothetical protein
MLVIHDEPEDAPADAAAETMERLALRADVERRALLLMKRAERLEARAARFSGKYEPITSTMSFAAATCSIVCVGMLPMDSTFRSCAGRAMPN